MDVAEDVGKAHPQAFGKPSIPGHNLVVMGNKADGAPALTWHFGKRVPA